MEIGEAWSGSWFLAFYCCIRVGETTVLGEGYTSAVFVDCCWTSFAFSGMMTMFCGDEAKACPNRSPQFPLLE